MLQMIPGYCGDHSFDISNQIWSLLKEPLVPSLGTVGCLVVRCGLLLLIRAI